MSKKSTEKGMEHLEFRIISNEISKIFKIFFRGSNKGIIGLVLFFPITFTLFMWLVFGQTSFNYPTAIVIEGYNNQNDLDLAMSNDELNETNLFISYINNYSLVKQTIVHSEVVEVTYSFDEVRTRFENLDVLVVVSIPEDFEQIIEKVRHGEEIDKNITINVKCANINEDLLKNLYFGIERKLKLYYDMEFPNEVEVSYIYENADPQRETYPRMWTIGSGGVVFSILAASTILGSAMIFIEKNSNMDSELIMISSKNRGNNYIGKVISAATMSTCFNFPFSLIVILSFLKMGFPTNLPALIFIVFVSNFFGACLGSIFGVLIPEQVFTFPVNVFIIIPTIFLCGGFMDIQLMGPLLKSIVEFIPFTYIFTLVKISILPGLIWNWTYFFGLLIYSCIFFIIGFYIYNRGMIKGWRK